MQNLFIMGAYRLLYGEIGQELGFSLKDGKIILHLSNANDAMRGDVANVGADMRRVISMANL